MLSENAPIAEFTFPASHAIQVLLEVADDVEL